ncbi:DNA-directed RNA polymerase I subunit RPA1-like [Oppia nitens]|uniref:DNA-directed RNA polymerase I subunit RPA1-like n=1 Tax=Oppia nitens TaxID=1686743 RepID=UPI0023D99BA4|nr:DNA-directed RNA polymerase I subunit RPA1-like [Oppia nitens]
MSQQINSQINGISFGVFTREEIKKLSVLNVETSKTFDELNHPTVNGLCDSVFGPANRGETCITCGLSEYDCCGHYGHINLALPVFNPFLIKQLFQLLKMCCFDCHHMLYTPTALETVIAQMEALNRGLDIIVEDLAQLGASLSVDCINLDAISIRMYVRDKLQEKIEDEYNKRYSKLIKCNLNVKNIVEKQQQIYKDFMSGKLLKPNKKCLQCSAHKQGLTVLNNALIVMNSLKANSKKSAIKDKNIANDEQTQDISELEMTGAKGKSHLTPIMARNHLRSLWSNEKDTLYRIFPFLRTDIPLESDSTPIDVFFMDTITVPPNRYRPMNFLSGRQFESEQTTALSQIIIASDVLDVAFRQAKQSKSRTSDAASTSTTITNQTSDKGKDVAKFHMCWQKLQLLCNRLYDSEMDRLPDNKATGVKQILEKKEGLFRKHMMGKRVNYAARSVISPDPYIMVDEIGVPLVFATKLSYPQPINDHNIEQLRQMVINGPDIYPGALSITYENGRTVRLRSDDPTFRKSLADRLLVPKHTFKDNTIRIVNRHLINGDALLLNRQPTLHKPSIMAHKARVLPKEKTLRLHYANCKCYNADFDGDEMNAHLPQSELARAEAYNIASVNYQYLVPKDGSPLSGLIQDHIIAGVKLTIRGKFFTKGDFQELLYGALSFLDSPIKLVPPAIIKPKPLWSGKQIITAIIINIVPQNKPLLTLSIPSKINPKILQSKKPRKWTAGGTPLQLTDMCDSQVIIRKGELISGFIDKVNLGPNPYGLIHCCYELYGGSVSSALLTSFARLCTNYLQIHHGFTLGIHDILVCDKPNAKRNKYITKAEKMGYKASAEAMGLTEDTNHESLTDKLKSAHTDTNDFYMKQLDKCMKGQTDELNNKITEVCLPKGLVKQFPENNLQMMIQAGAKGGSVNAIQISCLLGQIELEGRRVPLMMSGRTLPSFSPYETHPRAGGFVGQRFMTGIRPQEFFFHCMAGREGLIDTAVKTSRSGYLQRCLIKHLEGLVVNYDMTVRDSEGSVVQLLYGGDGIDILKSQMLKEKVLSIVVQNNEALKPTVKEIEILDKISDKKLHKYQEKVELWLNNYQSYGFKLKTSPFINFSSDMTRENNFSKEDLLKMWTQLKKKRKKQYLNICKSCPDPITSVFRPDLNLGSISEQMDSIINRYISDNTDNLLNNSSEPLSISSTEFRRTINSYYMKCLCQPGEAVGLLAAQSVGEPSTQMTLNTFHFAGRGEMNVTLGIPRLREILMTASSKIATPSLDIPFVNNYLGDIESESEKMRLKLNSVKLSDVLEFVEVTETLEVNGCVRYRTYDIMFQFLPKRLYKHKSYTNSSQILRFMENKFFKLLIEAINKRIKILTKSHGLFDHSNRVRNTIKNKNTSNDDNDNSNDGFETTTAANDNEEMSSDDENGNEDDGDTTAQRNKTRHNQEQEYEEPEDDEIQEVPDSDVEEVADDNASLANSDLDNSVQEINENEMSTISDLLVNQTSRRKEQLEAQLSERQNKVKNISTSIIDYDFDINKEEWCRLKIKYDLINSKLDMTSLIEDEARKMYVHKVGRIERAFLVKDSAAAKRNSNFAKLLKTEGVSLLDVVQYNHIFDINRIYTNDIHAIANTYGIEAAAAAIQREISNVFAVYGIHVDARHLSLIADYMTFSGQIKGMNRQSMDGVSPIQAMTFETTTNFLKNAALIGLKDDLSSPSARIVVGRVSVVGTGCVQMMSNPVLVTGTKPNQSFGSVIKANKWRSKSSSLKRRFNLNRVNETPPLNKRIKFA